MGIDDRFKGRPKPPEKDRFATLKAWVHWASKNPLNDDQALMAKDVNDLFALLGVRDKQIEESESSVAGLVEALEKENEELRVELGRFEAGENFIREAKLEMLLERVAGELDGICNAPKRLHNGVAGCISDVYVKRAEDARDLIRAALEKYRGEPWTG